MTMRVTILSTVMGESGSLLAAGSTYTVGDQFGQELVNSGRATDTDRALAVPQTELKPYFATDPLTGAVTGLVGPGGALLSLNVVRPPVKTLDPDGFWSMASYGEVGRYLYGFATTGGSQVTRLDRDTGIVSNFGVALPQNTITLVKPITESHVLVGTNNGTTTNSYYLTKDGGATWTLVLTMPFASTSLALHSDGLCVATINGSTVLLAGDYNTNASRVSGSTNDAVYLRRSDDLGETWTEVTRWNTDGTNNNTRHIHCVKQFNPNGSIYVMCGDSGTQTGIYRWDGVASWPVNVTPTNVVETSGLKASGGRQALRVVDAVMKDGYLWYGADSETGLGTGGALDAGIWKIREDLDVSTLTKVAFPNSLGLAQAIWYSVILSTGQMALVTGNAQPSDGQKFNQIILSNEDWTEFKAVGAYRAADATTYISPLILNEYNGALYVSCYGGAGKTDVSTVSCKVSDKDFRGDFETVYRPDTIHPVYWLDQANGNDVNNGYTKGTAFKSLYQALTGGRMTYGARLQIIGNYDHGSEAAAPGTLRSSVNPAMNGNARPGDEFEPLVIAGDGATKTILNYGTNSTSFVWFQMYGATAQKIELQDLRFNANKATGTPVYSDVAQGAGAHTFGYVRCIVGDYTNTTDKITRFAKSDGLYVYSLGSIFECPLGLANAAFESYAAVGNGNFYFENSVIFGGNRQVLLQGTGNKIGFRNFISVGAYQSVINIAAAATVTSKGALDCEFYLDQVPGAVVINDQASLTWAGEFKRCEVSGFGGGFGATAAFDGYSTLRKWPVPVIRYADYVY